jgi:hypothetical protein
MPNLKRFFATYRLELRLICWHWSYFILIVLWSGFVVRTYANDDLFSTRSMFYFAMGFSSLIGLIFAGIHVARSKRSRFEMLEIAFPSKVEVLFARWIAVITALAGLLIAPVGVALIIPATRLDPLFLPYIVFLTLLSSTFITGVIWVMQSTLGVRRWMYPFFVGLWLLGGLIPGTLTQRGLPVPGSSLVNFIMMEAPMNTLWGTLVQGQLPLWFTLFYIGLVVLFASIMLWRYTVKRLYYRSPLALGLTFVTLGVVIFAGISYTQQVAAANQQILADRERLRVSMAILTDSSEMPFIVTNYDLTFTHGELPRFTAKMNILNRSDTPLAELTFSLHHQFTITDTGFPFKQDENHFTLTLPEALAPNNELPLQVNYEGLLWVLEQALGRPPEAANFIHQDGVNMSYGIIWYPIPGQLIPNFSMVSPSRQTFNYLLLDEPAAFRLTIKSPADLVYTSNLPQVDEQIFASEGTTWATLVGAKGLKRQTEADFTLVTISNGFDQIAPKAEQFYIPLLSYIQQYFPQVKALTVQVLDIPQVISERYPPLAETLFAAISPRELGWLDLPQNQYYDGGEPLIISLFGGQANPLTENIAYFLWAHYISNGDSSEMKTIIADGLPSGRSNFYFSQSHEERYTIAAKLYDVYSTQGEEVTFELLREIQQQADDLSIQPSTAILEWITERAGAD